MARVEIVVKHSKFEFQDEVNKIIQNLKFEEFDKLCFRINIEKKE